MEINKPYDKSIINRFEFLRTEFKDVMTTYNIFLYIRNKNISKDLCPIIDKVLLSTLFRRVFLDLYLIFLNKNAFMTKEIIQIESDIMQHFSKDFMLNLKTYRDKKLAHKNQGLKIETLSQNEINNILKHARLSKDQDIIKICELHPDDTTLVKKIIEKYNNFDINDNNLKRSIIKTIPEITHDDLAEFFDYCNEKYVELNTRMNKLNYYRDYEDIKGNMKEFPDNSDIDSYFKSLMRSESKLEK